jgi:hypothetical protein
MKRHHDLGGEPGGPIDPAAHPVEPWAKLITATVGWVRSRGLITVDELRRTIEDLPPEIYDQPYFERWAEALAILLDEKGLAPSAEVGARMEQLLAEREAKP